MQSEPFLWNRYTEVEALGEGGMGMVVKAVDVGLDREVAIKRLKPSLMDNESQQRFLQEARATGQLQHPHIPPVYELGQDEAGNPYFALKLVRGQSLRELIDQLRGGDPALHEQYRFPHRLVIFQKVCEAVAYAHKRSILHRDIKPDNIMLGEFGEVFLMDWGLAKDQQAPAVTDPNACNFMGTVLYASPEQLSGEPADPLHDVYSLGATLYEWLSLKPPFEHKELRQLLTAVLTQKPTDPVFHFDSSQGRMPVEMSRLVMKAMHRDKAQRFASVQAMIDEIQSILDGEIRAVCPCTVVKSSFHGVSRLIDNYPILVVLVMLWLLYPLYAIVMALWAWLA